MDSFSVSEVPDDKADGNLSILYLGAMDRPRRLDMIVRAFAIVQRKFPTARLVMVGGAENPDDVEYLKDVVKEAGVSEQVIFTGFLDRQEAWRRVAQADVCLSPMYPSPMFITTTPTKCMEYLGHGKPVVGNDIPDMQKVLILSGGGVCVPWGDQHFARGICELLADLPAAQEMGKKGRKWILENRDYAILAAQLETRYAELLKDKGK
jgi:glycosyltransferase involved in cell wall biosynthesis